MPGVARVLGKAGVVVGLGLVLIGPTAPGADAVLPAPGITAAGYKIISEKAAGKATAKVTGQAKKTKSNAKAKQAKAKQAKAKHAKPEHKQRTATARQSQVGADLKPGVRTSPIVTNPASTHPARTRPASTHPARTRPASTHPASIHPARSHPARTHPPRTHLAGPKPKSPAKKHPNPPVTTPKPPITSRMNPVIHRRHRPSLAGSWSLFGGEFKFAKVGTRTISDTVISQRIGVFCPKVNDQDGQLVVRQLDKMGYIGTWEWFNPKTCESAGYGTVKIMVWRDKLTATFTAYPPPGTPGPPDTTMMERLH
jgi:hypothetical protein